MAMFKFYLNYTKEEFIEVEAEDAKEARKKAIAEIKSRPGDPIKSEIILLT